MRPLFPKEFEAEEARYGQRARLVWLSVYDKKLPIEEVWRLFALRIEGKQ